MRDLETIAREIMAATCVVKTERPAYEDAYSTFSWCETHTPDGGNPDGCWDGEGDQGVCPDALKAATAVLATFSVTRRPPPPPPERKRPALTAAIGHAWVTCQCGEGGCWFCGGSLGACTLCGGLEGSLPTHCPGASMGSFTERKVYTTDLDFVNGAWVRNPHKDYVFWMSKEIRRHAAPGLEESGQIRAAFDGVAQLPSMEREKMRRGW